MPDRSPAGHPVCVLRSPVRHRHVAGRRYRAAVQRRRFLQLGASVGLGAAVAGTPIAALARTRTPARSAATGRAYQTVGAFPAGVMSGDPTADGVILWTRIDPALAARGADVSWEVASDPAFGPTTVLASGQVRTDAASDHTVKVDVAGLGAATTAESVEITWPDGRKQVLADVKANQILKVTAAPTK